MTPLQALQLSTFHSFSLTQQFSQIYEPSIQWNQPQKRIRTQVVCVSTRPKRRKGGAAEDGHKSEAQELVRVLMKGCSEKEPLVRTLNKYVRVVRTEHCFMLFEELGRRDKWLQCLEVFRWMQKQRWYVPDNGVYSKLISVMGKKGQIRMAMWLFSEMRNSGCRPDTSVYNALISAHLHSKDKMKALAKVLGYFEKMKTIERCRPNVVTYNILLRAFAQARDVNQVNALLKDLDQSIISPDIYTYNGVMDGYGKNGMIREMESMLSSMRSNQLKPDIVTYNLLIDSYGKKQEFEKMELVYKNLLRSKEKPTLPTFNSMIINYGRARLKEKAEGIFEKMMAMGYTPSFITYESLIMMYGFCDCVSKARKVFNDMVESGKEVKVSTLNATLDVYCMNGLHMEAYLLLEDARNAGVLADSSTYKLLYRAYTRSNMKKLVERLLEHMDKDDIVPNRRFFVDALGASKALPVRPNSAIPNSVRSGPNNSEKT